MSEKNKINKSSFILVIVFSIILTSCSQGRNDKIGDLTCENIQTYDLGFNGIFDDIFARENSKTYFKIEKNKITTIYPVNSQLPTTTIYEGEFEKTKNNDFLPDGLDIFVIKQNSRKSRFSPNYFFWDVHGMNSLRIKKYGLATVYLYDCIE